MGQNTKIEWTHRQRADGSYIPGHTFNPWIGCAHKINEDGTPHPGCVHCYAEAFTGFTGKAKWGSEEQGGTRVKTSDKYWREPLKWNTEAEAAGERQIVFCASFADVFEPWIGHIQHHKGGVICRPYLERENTPEYWIASDSENLTRDPQGWSPIEMQDLRNELFKLIDATPWLDWLLLTKRPDCIRRMWPTAVHEVTRDGEPVGQLERTYRANVWLITSVSDQPTLYELWPQLAKCRDLVPVLGLSAEPLVGPMQIWHRTGLLPIDWIIVGGESGHHSRPMHPDWARSIRDQCQAAGVPFFFKQWGEWTPSTAENDPGKLFQYLDLQTRMSRVGKHDAGRLLDGREWREFPNNQAVVAR